MKHLWRSQRINVYRLPLAAISPAILGLGRPWSGSAVFGKTSQYHMWWSHHGFPKIFLQCFSTFLQVQVPVWRDPSNLGLVLHMWSSGFVVNGLVAISTGVLATWIAWHPGCLKGPFERHLKKMAIWINFGRVGSEFKICSAKSFFSVGILMFSL